MESQMQVNVSASIWCCLSESGFSLDELVIKLKKLFESEGFPGILKLILEVTQEQLIAESITKAESRSWGCCDGPEYVLNGQYSRGMKTSLGKIVMNWRRVKCKSCNKDLVPLKQFMGVSKHQYKSGELEQLVIDAAQKDSYRRSVESVGAQGFVRVSHSAAHRWVMESGCDEFDFSGKVGKDSGAIQLLPDGTCFKGRAQDGAARKGDLKVIIGVDKRGNVIPMGAWAGDSWSDIRGKIGDRLKRLPEGSILLSDGEIGISEAFAEMVDDEQRCHWHIKRDLYYTMWQNGGKMEDVRPIQKALAGVLAIEVPEEDFSKVTESQKDDIEERMEKAEAAVIKLTSYLQGQGYTSAATYLDNARRGMFGYVRRWLRSGIICPRASSMIERIMRELGRRLKKLSYNWSDKGVTKMARIILKKFTDPKQWNEYWKNKLRLDGNVTFGMISINLQLTQNSGMNTGKTNSGWTGMLRLG
jgi:hypothetical protein